MRKYDEMKAYYDKRIEELRHDVQFWRDKCLINGSVSGVHTAKIEMYEKILNKLLGERNETTDSVFIFEGKCYRPVNFNLNRDLEDHEDTLTVDFVKEFSVEGV